LNKFKLFIENFVVYGFGGIISKVIPLIMVPIITRLMPNTDYFGVSDLSNTIISFTSALAIMGMYDAMYRMFFEKEDKEFKKGICSTAFVFTILTSLIIFIIMLLFKEYISIIFFGDKQYSYVIYISAVATLVGATNSIISAPTRMQNKRKIFLVTNTISPIISYSISIPLLLNGYYVIALPLSAAISAFIMESTFAILNKEWFSVKYFDFKLLKQLLFIALPLMPNFLIYWIFNSSDKLMITNIIGIGAAGIYAVGSKLGHTSQLIYTAFAGGWQYFAFSTMNDNDQVKSNSTIFEYLGIISYICTFFVFIFSELIYNILFTTEYATGFIIAPYLFLAPLLQMLFQVAANQFLVVKKTWPNMFILSIGAISNIILNILLIPKIGIEGAAIATLAGYVISDIICVIVLCKMKLMVISDKFIKASLIMLIFIILWRIILINSLLLGIFTVLFICVIYLFIYKNDIGHLIKIFKYNR